MKCLILLAIIFKLIRNIEEILYKRFYLFIYHKSNSWFVVEDHLYCSKNLRKTSTIFVSFISRPPRHAGNIIIKERKKDSARFS